MQVYACDDCEAVESKENPIFRITTTTSRETGKFYTYTEVCKKCIFNHESGKTEFYPGYETELSLFEITVGMKLKPWFKDAIHSEVVEQYE